MEGLAPLVRGMADLSGQDDMTNSVNWLLNEMGDRTWDGTVLNRVALLEPPVPWLLSPSALLPTGHEIRLSAQGRIAAS